LNEWKRSGALTTTVINEFRANRKVSGALLDRADRVDRVEAQEDSVAAVVAAAVRVGHPADLGIAGRQQGGNGGRAQKMPGPFPVRKSAIGFGAKVASFS